MASESPATPPSQGEGVQGEGRRVVRMGKYEVVQHIATGGMGAVYRARDVEGNREVALKILAPELAASNPALLERFRREARNAGKLRHENIVTLYEFAEVNGTYIMAMEFVEGVDLHDYVRRKGTVDPEEARQIILQGARALRHADDHHIVHRDIKPSNFLLTRKGGKPHIKLADFGLAREITADEARVTRAGTTVGTLDYMSPEQARDSSSADIRSDLYSLGCTWYHLLAGHGPFPEGGLGERLIKIMSKAPPDLRELNPRVSEETWEIISRLLAKEPGDRYQSPVELIEDLLALEGKAVARPRTGNDRVRKVRRRPRRDETLADAPVTLADHRTNRMWYLLTGAAVLAAVIAIGLFLLRRGQPSEDHAAGDPPAVVPVDPGPVPPVGPVLPPPDNRGPRPPEQPARPPEKPRWASLYRPAEKIDFPALRQEIDASWPRETPPADAFVARISRSASEPGFRTLTDAIAAAPPGKAVVLDLHDNGPLFELPLAVEGRDLTVRAATGFQPLIVWDLPATLQLRRKQKKEDQPLAFFHVRKGTLRLEGLEVVCRWPETLPGSALFLDVEEGNLSARDCTFSAAGKAPDGFTLARLRSTGGTPVPPERPRCRLIRCQGRGAALAGLDLETPGTLALVDGCLLVGGPRPMLKVATSEKQPTRLRIVRSTLITEQTLMEVKPAPRERIPLLSCLCWDSLLARSSPAEGGTLLSLLDGAESRNMEWRAINTLYAGWRQLLGGQKPFSAEELTEWQRHWKRIEGDAVARDVWPEQQFNEPATQPASVYSPGKAVAFASSLDPEKPLGCDLSALPPTRDGWIVLALDPTASAPEAPGETVPDIPEPGDNRFHGARLDLSEADLGAYLAHMQMRFGLGPRVVLHLTGKGERPSAPIKIKGSTLVLHFEEPADADTPRLAIRLGTTTSAVPLLDIEDGGLEVYGGILRIADLGSARASHVVRVKGGDVKLFRTRIEGPQQTVPTGYQAALAFVGSGDPTPDKARTCALHECIVLSSRAGIVLDGIGSRLLVREALVVSAEEALALLPGPGCKGRASMHAVLDRVTFAARAVVRLGQAADRRDASLTGLVTDPVLVQARDCAYLNPFPGRPSKAGMLVVTGDALARGLLVWQGEREGFDHRLHFAVAPGLATVPDRKEGYRPWLRLWGSHGCREVRPELMPLLVFDPRRWALERLILRMKDPPGANLEKLGISPRRKG